MISLVLTKQTRKCFSLGLIQPGKLQKSYASGDPEQMLELVGDGSKTYMILSDLETLSNEEIMQDLYNASSDQYRIP